MQLLTLMKSCPHLLTWVLSPVTHRAQVWAKHSLLSCTVPSCELLVWILNAIPLGKEGASNGAERKGVGKEQQARRKKVRKWNE